MLQLRNFLPAFVLGALVYAAPAVAQVGPPTGPPPNLPKFPKAPQGFDEIFAHRDGRAIQALQYMQCMMNTTRAIDAGVMGQLPKDAMVVCAQDGTQWRGVIGTPARNAFGFSVLGQLAMDGQGRLTKAPIDTAVVAALARAQVRASQSPARGGGTVNFAYIPLMQSGYLELWFLPLQSNPTGAIVGGDSLIQMTQEGTSEMGHVRSAPPLRTIPLAKGNSYTLESTEEEIPLISELIVAHLSLSRVPEVHVRTKSYESVLSARTGKWVHKSRKTS